MEHPLKKTIEENLAGFLQKAIMKQVQNESEKYSMKESEIEYLPRPELPKYIKPKKVALTAGLYNFIHFNIIQLLP